MSDLDNLGAFFGKVLGASVVVRLFSWKKIRDAAAAAEEEYKVLEEDLAQVQQKLAETEGLAASRDIEIDSLNSRLTKANDEMDSLSTEMKTLEEKFAKMTKTVSTNASSVSHAAFVALNDQYKELSAAHTALLADRDALSADLSAERTAHLADNAQARTFRELYLSRESEIDGLRKELAGAAKEIVARQAKIDGFLGERDAKYAVLAAETERLSTLSRRLEEEKKAAELAARQSMVEIFEGHHAHVGEVLTKVCSDLHLALKTKATYQGTAAHPEFAVLVNSSYVFFNTVSPASPEETTEFAGRVAAEVKKLFEAAKEEGVRGEAYLVVPSAVAAQLTEFVFASERCTVFVVTPEALEAVVRTLQKIEEYEFTRQITPFELDQICRFIGELSHMTKRKIVLDTYFSNEMLEILQKAENLPTDVAADVVGYENAARMNPPVERDVAVLTIPSLSAKVQKLEKAMLARAAVESEDAEE
ncbi:MAG TPA: hypothetical protein O0X23_00320 [Methanocorpusculum sp.]|nr:hypothetical protein [Methanocorpusculum sp.]